MTAPLLRPVEPSDLTAALALNAEWVPEVGEVDAARLAHIVEQASLALVAIDPDPTDESDDTDGSADTLLGLVVVMAPGADYDSPNYGYFERARADGDIEDFRYVDRIVVATAAHRRGVGRLLYGAVFDHARDAGATVVACEVNVDPPNPVSTAFHSSLGFVEVGRQSNYDGAVTVAFMTAPVAPAR
ncbi:MAG: GNAT family N-acetyltransferase [Actinomycetota bacterium]|nr:GNAT family N-acetyltransferase [Actinomycetota bacterium]